MQDRFGGPRALWRFLAVAVVAVAVFRVVGYVSFVDPPALTENDYSPDYVSAKEWRSGGDPYAPLPVLNEKYFGADDATARQYEPDQRNPHPPSLLLFYAPLSAATIETARLILLAAMLVSTFLAVFVFLKEIGIVTSTAAVVGIGALALPIVGFDQRWAQMNGFLLLSFVLAWRDLRRGHELRAGLLLGLVTALKIFPWMFLVPLLRTKRMKAAGWMLASAIGFTLLSVAAMGIGPARTFLEVATPGNVEIWGAAPNSISLVTLPFRLFASSRWLDPSVAVPSYVGWIGVLAVVACLLAAWHNTAAVSKDPFWAVVPWMILATPIAWPHYLVVALPLGLMMLLRSGSASRQLQVGVGVGFVLFAVGPSYLDWLSGVGGFSLKDYGNVVAGTTILMAGLGVMGFADLRAGRSRGSDGRRDADNGVSAGVRDRDVDAGP
jgi:hypothetical protein